MKILSFDVGIKNLAYCLLKLENGSITIDKWDVINLVDEQKITCGEKLKSGKICGKLPKFFGKLMDGSTRHYCGTHQTMYQPFEDDLETTMVKSITTEDKCTYVYPKKNEPCSKTAQFEIDGQKYCRIHKALTLGKLSNTFKLKKFKKTKSSSLSPLTITTRMYQQLDKLDYVLNVDEVLIENQPTLKNPTMKTISSVLFSYFVMRGVVDKDDQNKINNVRFISPSNKLKVNEDNTLEVLSKTKKGDTYKLTKQLAIQYTKMLLKNSQDWLDYLEKYKKKDDLCDAYLQGYHYLYKNHK